MDKICSVWSNSILCLFFFRYFLQPRENGGKSVKVEELGSLRLNIVYTEDHVFPSEHYTPLRDLLLQSANVGVRVHEPALLGCILVCRSITNYRFAPPPCPFSQCRRPQLIFWGRCVERNKKLPSPSCVCFFTMARLCLLSAPSLTLKSTAHSECLLKLSIHDPWLSLLNQGLIYAWITTFGLWIKKWGHIRISTGLAFCV